MQILCAPVGCGHPVEPGAEASPASEAVPGPVRGWPRCRCPALRESLAGTIPFGLDTHAADIAALMEFHANNPTAPNKPIAVMMVYNNTPAAVLALKKSGIRTPADLNGKKLGAPVFDAGRKAFPIFAKANGIANVTWTAMDPTLRETMLVRGDIDAITGFSFTSLLNLEARGVKADDVVVLSYPSYGVKLYGNAVIVSQSFLA